MGFCTSTSLQTPTTSKVFFPSTPCSPTPRLPATSHELPTCGNWQVESPFVFAQCWSLPVRARIQLQCIAALLIGHKKHEPCIRQLMPLGVRLWKDDSFQQAIQETVKYLFGLDRR